MSCLEFATNQELIDELTKRVTFVGVLVYSQDEQKFAQQIHSNLRVFTSADRDGTLTMLEVAEIAIKQ